MAPHQLSQLLSLQWIHTKSVNVCGTVSPYIVMSITDNASLKFSVPYFCWKMSCTSCTSFLDELAASDTPSGMDSSADSVWKIKGNYRMHAVGRIEY